MNCVYLTGEKAEAKRLSDIRATSSEDGELRANQDLLCREGGVVGVEEDLYHSSCSRAQRDSEACKRCR